MPRTEFRRRLGLGFITLTICACAPDWEGVFGGSSEGGAGEGGATNATTSSNSSSSTSSMGGTSTNSSSTTETASSVGGQTNSSVTTDQAATTSTSETVATSTTSSPDVTATTSGDPPGPSVDCGGIACDVSMGGSCCFDLKDEQVQCSPNDNCSGNEVVLTCDQPADCPDGTVCCALRDFGQQAYDATACVQECYDPSRVLCDPNGPPCDPFEIAGFVIQPVCKQSALLPDGYFICSASN